MSLGLRSKALHAIAKYKKARQRGLIKPISLTRHLKVAVIGTGGVAPSHLEALKAIGNVTIVGIANRGGTDPATMAKRFGIVRHFTNYQTMLDETKPDAIIILVSHGQSKAIVADCLERGIPILCEKPAGQNPIDAVELASIANETGTLCAVGLNRRFYSTINTALAKIREKGPVLGISVDFAQPIRGLRNEGRFNSDELDRWQLFYGIHSMDLFRHVCGEVEEVHALRRRFEEVNGDNFAATIAFKSGAIGSYRSHWVSGLGRHLSARIFGNGISAEFPTLETCFIKTETNRIPTPLPPSPEDIVFKPGVYRQAAVFLTAVAQNAEELPPPLISLQDAVGTMELVEKLAFSAPLLPAPR